MDTNNTEIPGLSQGKAPSAMKGFEELSASADVICEEFLKVLSRTEAEQPIICQKVCICQQFWRYQHYLLPRWEWGVNKIVCFGLGSFSNVIKNGGPFPGSEEGQSYRDVLRNTDLLAEFNMEQVDRHNALQTMLRHIAAIEMASFLKFCSSKRGVEHQLIKHYFKKLNAIQTLSDPELVIEIAEKTVEKLNKMPPTAGYAGDGDLTDVPVYFHDSEYTEDDKVALQRLSPVLMTAHLPPIEVLDTDVQVPDDLVDEHTLVYTVDPDYPIRSLVLGQSKPAAMIWPSHGPSSERNHVSTVKARGVLEGYEVFELDNTAAPHTIGSSHLYIRKDVVEKTATAEIVPPYPVTFPHDYPYEHKSWYLDELKTRERIREI